MDDRPLHVGMLVTYDLCEPGGGVKQHARQLAEALRDMGDRVTLFGPSSYSIDAPHIRGFRGVVDISSNGSGNRLGIFVSPVALWRFIRQQQFDVLHIHEPLPPVVPYYATWMSPGVPKIATFHAYSERSSLMLLAARRVFGPFILPFIHRGIAVSEPASRHARIDWSGPLNIIPNGICARVFSPGAYRSSHRELRLLFVGRTVNERKGFGYLLEAVARARVGGVNVQLHLVGEQEPRTAKLLPPYVIHHGPLSESELAAQYRACDVFIAPSTGQESFGIVLLEAMSAARPVICSDIDGYRQAANPAGTRWVPPRDADALCRAILELAARPDERRRMGDSNVRYVRQFDWALLTPRIREEYWQTIIDYRRSQTGVSRTRSSLPKLAPSNVASCARMPRLSPPDQLMSDG